jgi:tetratricopeptide (TPR) repeat protein
MYELGKNSYKKEYQIIRFLLPALILLNICIFIIEIQDLKSFFSFNGHFYNFNAGKITDLSIFIFLVWFTISGIRKSRSLKKELKTSGYQFVTVLNLFIIIPGITNILQNRGVIPKELHESLSTIIPVISIFSVFLIYNKIISKKISENTKFIGIISCGLIVIIQISFTYISGAQESLFDNHNFSEALKLKEIRDTAPGLKYLVKINTGDIKNQYLYKSNDVEIDANLFKSGKLSCRIDNSSLLRNKNISEKRIVNLTGADTVFYNNRIYRCDQQSDSLYIGYLFFDRDDNLYEAGYSYIRYRMFINQPAQDILFLIFITGILYLIFIYLAVRFKLFTSKRFDFHTEAIPQGGRSADYEFISDDNKFDKPQKLYKSGKSFLKRGQFDKAGKYFKEYLVGHPDDAEVCFYLSICYKKRRDYKRAIKLGKRVRKLHPENTSNLVFLADNYRLTGDIKRGLETIDAALKIEPGKSSALKVKKILKDEFPGIDKIY